VNYQKEVHRKIVLIIVKIIVIQKTIKKSKKKKKMMMMKIVLNRNYQFKTPKQKNHHNLVLITIAKVQIIKVQPQVKKYPRALRTNETVYFQFKGINFF
jgi:hypothetical protein